MDRPADKRSQASGTSELDNNLSDIAASDVDVDSASEIRDALDDIKFSGTFACFNPLPTTSFVRPEIEVTGVGPVKLPLSEEQARQLIAQSRQAPFGKGNETIVDTSELGIRQGSIRALLYKMLIYEKGAMFKAHTDTEKIAGMFGSLVICLPSPHEGGDVVVQHRGHKKTFKTSTLEQSYACWYSDVLHEVLPVRSGYRWVLTYNLTRGPTEPRPTAALLGSDPGKLRQALRRWLSIKDAGLLDHFYYGLEHEYTEANISLNRLKSTDFARGQCLQHMSLEFDVDIFLAILAKEESGPCESNYDGNRARRWDDFSEDEDEDSFHHLVEVSESQFYIKKLVDLDGHHVLGGMLFSEDNLLQDNFFDGLTGEEIEYQRYMGNYGPDATHMYRAAAVVIVRRDATLNLLLGSTDGDLRGGGKGDNLLSLVGYYAELSSRPSPQPSAWKTLQFLCGQAWPDVEAGTGRTAEIPFGGETAVRVLKAAITLKKWLFLELAVSRLQGKLPPEFFSWVRDYMTATDLPMGRIHKDLLAVVLFYPSLHERLAAISNFAPVGTEVPEERRQWARTATVESLASSTSLTLGEEDGWSVLDMVKNHYNFDFLSESVVPLVRTRITTDVSFALAFLSTLHKYGTDGVLPTEEATGLYKDIAKSFIGALHPENIRSAELLAAKSSRHSYSTLPRPSESDLARAVRHQALTGFVTSVLELGTEGESLMESFHRRLILDAKRIPSGEFHPFWLPFLRSLVDILDAKQIPPSTSRYQQIFTAILSSYIDCYVGTMPNEDRSLARRGVSCSCGDCVLLNAFLADPQRRVGRFPLNKGRRAHLHSQLTGHDCSHETDRVGLPQALVVTKTFVHNERARAAWKAKKAEALKQLAGFDQHSLRMLLGSDYSTITGMEHLSATSGPADATSAGPANVSRASAQISKSGNPRKAALPSPSSTRLPSRSVAGMKRKASETEPIDLTGDSN